MIEFPTPQISLNWYLEGAMYLRHKIDPRDNNPPAHHCISLPENSDTGTALGQWGPNRSKRAPCAIGVKHLIV